MNFFNYAAYRRQPYQQPSSWWRGPQQSPQQSFLQNYQSPAMNWTRPSVGMGWGGIQRTGNIGPTNAPPLNPINANPPVGQPVDRNPNKPGLGWGKGGRPANDPGLSRGKSPLDIITANLSSYKGWGHTKKSLDALLARDPRFMGLQEMRGDKIMRKTRRYLGKQGYGFYGKYGTPIAFDKSEVKLKDRGFKHLTNPTFVGARGAGASTLKTQRANYGVFKDKKTGQLQSVTNVHFSPSQYIPIRKRLAGIQARKTGQLQRQLQQQYGNKLAQYVLGDMNATGGRSVNAIKKGGVRAFKAPTGTLGKREIDWIMGDRGIRRRTVFNTASDHHAYGARFGKMKRYKP